MQMHGVRIRDVEIRHFVFANHAGSVGKGVFIAEIIRSKACFVLWVGEGELDRFREVADVGDGNLQAVFGGLNRGKGNINIGIDIGALFSGDCREQGSEEDAEERQCAVRHILLLCCGV